MYCCRKVTDDLFWVGANDRKLARFEGVYAVPRGMAYNSYLLMDEKTVLFDTADAAVAERFFENIAHVLGDRPLDYVVVHHMEPDHSATLGALLLRHPGAQIICNAKTAGLIRQFGLPAAADGAMIVKEGETFSTGKHTLSFINAPMVHWPEVMMTYDTAEGILFSADAFGSFGALDGALFADEVDFDRDHLDEARRYYANIVGKYGPQVQNVLKKTAALDIRMLCPLHGFVWRSDIAKILEKYSLWSSYTPEEKGVVIATGSVYGHTDNAAEILSCMLREAGVRTVMYDLASVPAADVVAAVFRYSHLVVASATTNNGLFVKTEDFLHDLTAHNIQNRTVGIIENGSWAPVAGKLIRERLAGCKNMQVLESGVTIKSALGDAQRAELEALAAALKESME